jgi:hypothetical protein
VIGDNLVKWLESLSGNEALLTALGVLVSTVVGAMVTGWAKAWLNVRKMLAADTGPVAPAPLPREAPLPRPASAQSAIAQLESELGNLKWDHELLTRRLEDARREIAQLQSALTRARLDHEETLAERDAAKSRLDRMAHALELDRIEQRLHDSGLTPIDEPPPLPTRVARRPRRTT